MSDRRIRPRWKEYELEVMRDTKDNVIIICSIENFDPMGVHTRLHHRARRKRLPTRVPGDARRRDCRDPRDRSRDRRVEHPVRRQSFDGRMVVIEMNRVFRGRRLWRRKPPASRSQKSPPSSRRLYARRDSNDITRKTPPASSHARLRSREDPKWQFEKFPGADESLGPQMKSVGE